jgi:hypothetical protein
LWDEALESSQGQLLYWHHLAALRWQGEPLGAWQPWADLQAQIERFAGFAEMNSASPSLGMGVDGPLPGNGRGQAEARWRWDATDDDAYRAQGSSMHMAAQWRMGLAFSPRVDLDAKAQAFPHWPGRPNRRDLLLDGRVELVLWQRGRLALSAALEAWKHASDEAAYAGQGTTGWFGGTGSW